MAHTINNQLTTLKVPNYQNTSRTQSTEHSQQPGSGPDVNGAENDAVALTAVERMASVAGARENVDAVRSRFESTTSNLQAGAEQPFAAGEHIVDVDHAIGIAMLTVGQIMQQSGKAMSVQANMSQQSVLQLLG